MTLILKNTVYSDQGIFGTLNNEDGSEICKTLQHAYDSGLGTGSYVPKLPPGTYQCVRGEHQLLHGLPFETFEITGVPGHTGVLFHIGNYNADSEGCVLLGSTISPDDQNPTMIQNSAVAFEAFMRLLAGIDSFILEVM